MDPKRLHELKLRAQESVLNSDEELASGTLHDLQVYQAELEAQFQELLETEKRLERVNDRFRRILDVAPVGFILLDKLDRIIDVNQVALNIFNVEAYRVRNRSLFPLFGDDVDVAPILKWLIDESRSDYEFEITSAPGNLFRMTKVAIGEDTLLAVSELSSNNRFIEEFKQAKASAEDANTSKELFLSTIVHEMRSPMGGLLGAFELLSRSVLTEHQQNLVEKGRNSLGQLTDIVNDTNTFSLLTKGDVTLNEVHFDIEGALCDIVNLHRDYADGKGLELHFDSKLDGNQFYLGDKVLLSQVVNNILNNAIKFSNRGEVNVSVTYTPTTDQNTHSVIIVVKDTGVGIPKESLPRIFEYYKYRHNHIAPENPVGGVGIGLYIAKGLCELMGGQILVESAPGEGATFSIIVPLVVGSKTTTDIKFSDTTNLNLRDKTIFIVDDNPINLEVLDGMLENTQAHVRRFTSAIDLLTAYRASKADIVIADILMPEMDGYALVKQLRKDGFKGPAIAVTASLENTDKASIMDVGYNRMLEKPYSLEQLYQCLAEFS